VALVFLYGLNLAPMMFETFTSDRTWASSLTSSGGSLSRDVLQFRANRWIFLNYFRNAAGVLAYIALMFAVLVRSVQ